MASDVGLAPLMINRMGFWLLEQEVQWALADNDWDLVFQLLLWYTPWLMRWFDTHHVKSNPTNLRIAGRIARVWKSVGVNWLVIPEHPCAPVAIRLAGLFPSYHY